LEYEIRRDPFATGSPAIDDLFARAKAASPLRFAAALHKRSNQKRIAIEQMRVE